MATIYVRSTDGSNSDNGTTWALAKLDLAGAAAIDAAGDTIYVSQNHAESTAAAITVALAGTAASPVKVICGNDAAEPPTAVAATATVATTGTSGITMSGTNFYVYGLTYQAGSGTGNLALSLSGTSGSRSRYRNCKFEIGSTGVGCDIRVGNGSVELAECWVKFANASQSFRMDIAAVTGLYWDGGGLSAGGTSPSSLISANAGNKLVLSGLDLTNADAAINIFKHSSNTSAGGSIRNSQLPASWSGSVSTGTLYPGCRYEMYNCDSGDTNYALRIDDYAGSIVHETTIVRTGGASDGTTLLSWKLASSANAEYPHITLDTPEIVKWNETTASSITATVEIVTDNVTLTDAECWLEIQYLGTSGVPLGTFADDAKADVLATAANQTTSTETWTTTGLTTPVKQKLSVTFTPQEKGFIHAVVKLAKASATVYVDPKLTVA